MTGTGQNVPDPAGRTRALICGVTGQDGAYLSQFLIGRGYEVWGTTRDLRCANSANLDLLGLVGRIKLVAMSPDDMGQVREALELAQPDEVYWLAGQSSVGESFVSPMHTIRGIVAGTLNLLEALRVAHPHVRFFNASSCECFGDVGMQAAHEWMRFRPVSPYAAAKAAAHAMVQSYRSGFGLFAANGIMFNHESPLRGTQFVTRKVVAAAARAAKDSSTLMLGRLDVARDWGWAPDYVDSMWRILQHDRPEDFVIATGHCHALMDFVALAYSHFDLDWKRFVRSDATLVRPSDRSWSQGDPRKAAEQLGWEAHHLMPDVVRLMCEAECTTR